jgi:trans-2,3-dihydro-3-hydroxyanthranilate isomerase
MARYPFFQVDAFTTRALGGNPCAVVFDSEALDDEMMLAIAREMNLSETAFVRHSDIADFAVRYFTPTEEIPLAGHPTIATTMALVYAGRLKLEQQAYRSIQLELRDGPITVEISAREGQVERITMTQRRPLFLRTHAPEDVLPAFGLTSEDLLPGFPIQTVSTGTPQLMIPLRSHEVLRRARVDIDAYTHLRNSADFFSPHLFCLQGATAKGLTFARHIGPPPTSEDPATGSATGGMAAYLWRYRLIKQPTFMAEQGHWMERPSEISVEIIGQPDNIETVKIGGSAVVVVQGELLL